MKKDDKGTLAVWNIKASEFPYNGKIENKVKFLLRYAILAPSGHNTQPWKFRFENNILLIMPDFSRNRPAVDPDNRELFISLGCAVKNFEIAADYFGVMYEKKYLGENIEFSFVDGQRESKNETLFESILKRSTNRGDYEMKRLPSEVLDKVRDLKATVVTDEETKQKIAEIAYASNKVWYKSKQLVEELDYWLSDDIESGNDGVPTGMLNLYKIAVDLKQFLSKDSLEAENKALREKKLAMDAPAIIVVSSKLEDIESWIKAGEKYEQISLSLASKGISNGFFNTIIELNTQRKKLENVLGGNTKPQLIMRAGYAKEEAPKSPRRELKYCYESTSIH